MSADSILPNKSMDGDGSKNIRSDNIRCECTWLASDFSLGTIPLINKQTVQCVIYVLWFGFSEPKRLVYYVIYYYLTSQLSVNESNSISFISHKRPQDESPCKLSAFAEKDKFVVSHFSNITQHLFLGSIPLIDS